MSLTRPIPKTTRAELAADPLMHVCSFASEICTPKIDWHHALRFKGQRVDDPNSIIALCSYHHSLADRTDWKEKIDWIMLFVKHLDISLYPRSGLDQRKKYLQEKYKNRP